LPVPPRWHLRTQVSRKTLFDLIQDTLPPAGLQVTGAPDAPGARGGATAPEDATAGPGPGVLPQSYLDALAATVPMPLHPAAMWNDGDTTPDLPEQWRPITITLASTPALPPPALAPAPAPRRPLQGAVKTAGWMLAGAALTFLVSAAAFGGRPMLRAIRGVMAPHAQTSPDGPIPATQNAPAPPSRAVTGSATVVAIAERPEAKAHPLAGASPSFTGADRAPGNPAGDPGADGERRAGAAAAHPSHRVRQESRQDRRPGRSATSTEAGRADPALLGADDAVMPLASGATDPPVGAAAKGTAAAKPTVVLGTPVLTRTPAMARTLPSRALRPIDVEDPFGGR